MTAWAEAGGDLFRYFASTSTWSKWGSWGIVQWFDEDVAKAPKFMATMRRAQQCGQTVNADRLPDQSPIGASSWSTKSRLPSTRPATGKWTI